MSVAISWPLVVESLPIFHLSARSNMLDLNHFQGESGAGILVALSRGRTPMPDTATEFQRKMPQKADRTKECHQAAVFALALRSLLAVKADKDASWPCRVRPVRQLVRHDALH